MTMVEWRHQVQARHIEWHSDQKTWARDRLAILRQIPRFQNSDNHIVIANKECAPNQRHHVVQHPTSISFKVHRCKAFLLLHLENPYLRERVV
ncbi:hypothetical protein SDC9_180827 [bioreactor metagenome]|uniref:Uncharacterized protein n=1 Tax=bioreactor metagenome TaxID=1076179 RepID=A0A645H2S8_9ZZZZ